METTPVESTNDTTRRLSGVSIAVLAIIIVGAGLWYYFGNPSGASRPFGDNPAFLEGRALQEGGEYANARAKFEEALPRTSDPEEIAHIKSSIALMKRYEGDFVGSVAMYKEVAGTDTSPGILRAHAVRAMGEMSNYDGDPAVRAAVYSSAPYASFLVNGDFELSSRHLYEYASSFYPLASSELQIASWYARELARDVKTKTLTAEERAQYRSTAEKHLENAETDMARVTNTSAEEDLIPSILNTKAFVISRLALAGIGTHEDADAAYAAALAAYNKRGEVSDGRTRLRYAIYLQARGDMDAALKQLEPIYTNENYERSPVASLLIAEEKNYLGQKAAIEKFAEADPKFKVFLVKLGWTFTP